MKLLQVKLQKIRGIIIEQVNPIELINNPKEERTIQFLKRFNAINE